MNTPLQKAAQAMIDRWDSPYWKLAPTADYIAGLRKALDAELQQSVEPYAVFHGLVDSGEHGAFNLDLLKMIPRGAYLYLHPPQQSTVSEAWTAWQAEGEALIEGKNNGGLFALGGWWADRPWRIKP